MKIAQWIILIMLLLRLYSALELSVKGRKASEPLGLAGVITSLVMFSLIAYVYFKAGALSELP